MMIFLHIFLAISFFFLHRLEWILSQPPMCERDYSGRLTDSGIPFFQHSSTLKRRSLPWIGWFFSRYLDVIIISNQPGINENLMPQPRFGHTCLVESCLEECLETIGPKEKIEFGVWCYKSKRSMRDEKIFWCFQVFWDAYLKSDYMHWCNVVFHVRFSTPRSGDCLLCFNDRPGRGWRCFSTQKQMNMFQVAAGDVQGRKVSEENDWMILGNDDVLLRFFFVSWIGLLLWF